MRLTIEKGSTSLFINHNALLVQHPIDPNRPSQPNLGFKVAKQMIGIQ
jgi:hypothetical protein